MKCKWCGTEIEPNVDIECTPCWITFHYMEETDIFIVLRMLAEIVTEKENTTDKTSTEHHNLSDAEWKMIMLDADKLEQGEFE